MPGGGKITIELRNIELDRSALPHTRRFSRRLRRDVSERYGDRSDPRRSRGSSSRSSPQRRVEGDGTRTRNGGIVQQNNGSIEVQSRIGHSTTFYIYLRNRPGKAGADALRVDGWRQRNHSARRR